MSDNETVPKITNVLPATKASTEQPSNDWPTRTLRKALARGIVQNNTHLRRAEAMLRGQQVKSGNRRSAAPVRVVVKGQMSKLMAANLAKKVAEKAKVKVTK